MNVGGPTFALPPTFLLCDPPWTQLLSDATLHRHTRHTHNPDAKQALEAKAQADASRHTAQKHVGEAAASEARLKSEHQAAELWRQRCGRLQHQVEEAETQVQDAGRMLAELQLAAGARDERIRELRYEEGGKECCVDLRRPYSGHIERDHVKGKK